MNRKTLWIMLLFLSVIPAACGSATSGGASGITTPNPNASKGDRLGLIQKGEIEFGEEVVGKMDNAGTMHGYTFRGKRGIEFSAQVQPTSSYNARLWVFGPKLDGGYHEEAQVRDMSPGASRVEDTIEENGKYMIVVQLPADGGAVPTYDLTLKCQSGSCGQSSLDRANDDNDDIPDKLKWAIQSLTKNAFHSGCISDDPLRFEKVAMQDVDSELADKVERYHDREGQDHPDNEPELFLAKSSGGSETVGYAAKFILNQHPWGAYAMEYRFYDLQFNLVKSIPVTKSGAVDDPECKFAMSAEEKNRKFMEHLASEISRGNIIGDSLTTEQYYLKDFTPEQAPENFVAEVEEYKEERGHDHPDNDLRLFNVVRDGEVIGFAGSFVLDWQPDSNVKFVKMVQFYDVDGHSVAKAQWDVR